MPIVFHRADELGPHARTTVAELFADGFGRELSYFVPGGESFSGFDTTTDLPDESKRALAVALEHMFVLDHFHVALLDGVPAALTICDDGTEHAFRPRWRELVRHLGPVKGTIAAVVFKREFQKRTSDTAPGRAFVASVATARTFRGRGVGTALMEHLLTLPAYTEYVLEDIADTNTAALRLYKKVGYREFRRVRVGHTKRTGIRYYVSMRLSQV